MRLPKAITLGDVHAHECVISKEKAEHIQKRFIEQFAKAEEWRLKQMLDVRNAPLTVRRNDT